MKIFAADLPNFIKRELEQLQDTLSPFLRKVSKYTIWSIPLIGISLINLFIFLVFVKNYQETMPIIVFFSVLCSIGLALSKEVKFQQKEIRKKSTSYIIKRIKKSEVVSTQSKEKYTSLIKTQPINALNYFIQFLEEENRASQLN